MEIVMIFAKKCPQCRSMRQTINSVSNYLGVDITLKEYDCTKEDAIDIALKYNISDVPGCNINGEIIEGEDFSPEDIVNALKKLGK